MPPKSLPQSSKRSSNSSKSDARLNSFGRHLLDLRRQAGDISMDEVVDLYAVKAKALGLKTISKSVLSLYERGKIETPKPETLKILAEIYQTSYESLASTWFCERYKVSLKTGTLLVTASDGAYRVPNPGGRGAVNLITMERHRKNQAALPPGSEVAVVTVNLLDSEGEFFKLVANNLKRGVKYRYLLSEEYRIEFESFLKKLENYSRPLKDIISKSDALKFIPRPSLALPMSYVLYLLPKGELRAYLSLPEGGFPLFYLACDDRLSLELYNSYRWNVTISENYEIRRSLAILQIDVDERRRVEKTRSLESY